MNPMQQIRDIIDDPVYSCEGKLARVRAIINQPQKDDPQKVADQLNAKRKMEQGE